jgi:hypothetical protein
LCLVGGVVVEVLDDVVQADVGADDAAEEADDEDGRVLGQTPLEAGRSVPV